MRNSAPTVNRPWNPDLCRRWVIDGQGRLEPDGPGPEGELIAAGRLAPAAECGWIELIKGGSRPHDDLIAVLQRLETPLPGFRWFVRDDARAEA